MTFPTTVVQGQGGGAAFRLVLINFLDFGVVLLGTLWAPYPLGGPGGLLFVGKFRRKQVPRPVIVDPILLCPCATQPFLGHPVSLSS